MKARMLITAAALSLTMLGANAFAADGFDRLAGEPGWQLAQHKMVSSAGGFVHSDECDHAARAANTAPVAQENGFEYIGGEPGWQLEPHKMVLGANGFVHSDECDHEIRMVAGPTAADRDALAKAYTGG